MRIRSLFVALGLGTAAACGSVEEGPYNVRYDGDTMTCHGGNQYAVSVHYRGPSQSGIVGRFRKPSSVGSSTKFFPAIGRTEDGFPTSVAIMFRDENGKYTVEGDSVQVLEGIFNPHGSALAYCHAGYENEQESLKRRRELRKEYENDSAAPQARSQIALAR